MRLLSYFILGLICTTGFAQEAFQLEDGRKRTSKKFDLSFNLIKVKAEVNGLELNFLVDTGLKRTIVFNLPKGDSLTINEGYRTTLRGFGKEKPIEAIYSQGNTMTLGKLKNKDAHIVFIDAMDTDINLKMGADVNGIIGSDLFRELVVMVDYKNEKLSFYQDRSALRRRQRRYQTLPIEVVADKPYLDLELTAEGAQHSMKTLIDTGSSSSLWYYAAEEVVNPLPKPKKGFEDYLGWGVSGQIVGWRSKIDGLKMGTIEFSDVTIAFPNEESLLNAEGNVLYEQGSIGGEIFRRTKIIFDYPNEQISISPERDLVKDGFYYNMSGISLSYGQVEAVAKLTSHQPNVFSDNNLNKSFYTNRYGETKSDSRSIMSSYTVSYEILPSIQIDHVTKNTPAAAVGIRAGDVIYKINGTIASNMGIDDIADIFTRSPGKKIKMKIRRDGKILKKSFRLVPLID